MIDRYNGLDMKGGVRATNPRGRTCNELGKYEPAYASTKSDPLLD